MEYFKEKIEIGRIRAKNRIWLAPMAEITDKFYRKKASQLGAGFAFSGMVSVKGLLHNYDSTMKKVGNFYKGEMFSFQLFGDDAKDFYNAVKLLIEKEDLHIFDINAGCPVKKVVKTGSGSALILHPEKIYDIVKILKDNFDITLSVKTRKGWNETVNSEKLIKLAAKAGADFIILHPRTREQMYTETIDIDYAYHIKNNFDIPIILSGDIKTKKDLEDKKIFDGVMVGRSAFKNISIFSELLDMDIRINFKDLALEHLDYYNKQYKRISGFKKFLPIYLEHSILDKRERNKVYSLKTYEEIRETIEKFIKS